MRWLRIAGAAFLVLLGAMVLVGWSMAGKTVAAIEDGSAATKLTQKLLDDPGFADAAAGRITDRLVERTEGRFIGKIVVAFEPEIQTAIANVLASDRVDEAVTNSVQKLEAELTAQITAPDRPSAPFVITIDLSDRVNDRIDQIPVVGPFIPEVTVPPIEREVMDAATFDSVRQVYGGLKLVATWGLIAGVLLIVAGFFVAPRTRWYWASALVGIAFVVFAVSVAVRRVIPAQIAAAAPGGETGGSGTFLSNFVADNASGPIASRLLGMAVVAFVLAILFAVIARFLPGLRDQYLPRPVTADAVVEPAGFVAPAGIPTTTVVADTAVVVDEVVVVEGVAVVEEVAVVDEVAVEEVAAAEELAEQEPVAEPADAIIVEDSPEIVPAPAPKPRAKRAPAKKAEPVEPPAAEAKPAPKPRTRKPTTPKE